MSNNFERILNPGFILDYNDRKMPVFVKVSVNDGKLSIFGVEGPMKNGDCRGSCGQIRTKSSEFVEFCDGWNAEAVNKLNDIWNEWHLNDMCAGSPAQREELAKHEYVNNYPSSHYEWAVDILEKAGINPDESHIIDDEPYRYGSAWLFKEVPDDVYEFLRTVPESEVTPAWI